MEMRQSGHIPAALDAIVRSDMGMIRPARGTAIRFVSRKYWGKVLKYSQARGPVVIWQEMDMDALSHIFLIGPFRQQPVRASVHKRRNKEAEKFPEPQRVKTKTLYIK